MGLGQVNNIYMYIPVHIIFVVFFEAEKWGPPFSFLLLMNPIFPV